MILIITPLQKEYIALFDSFAKKSIEINEKFIGKLKCLELVGFNTLITIGGHGKTQFAVQTQYLIDHFTDCELVLCTGAAGSLSKELNVGDIVIGVETIEHDYLVKFGTAPSPVFSGHKETIDRLKELLMNFTFSIHYGSIASGDEDIISNKRAKELFDATGALCVAWEGAGGAKATMFNEIPYLEIRCITDSADKSTPVDFNNNINIAMGNFAELYYKWQKNN